MVFNTWSNLWSCGSSWLV